MTKKLVFAALIVSILLAGGLVLAGGTGGWGHGHGHGMAHGHGAGHGLPPAAFKLIRDLDLDDQQNERLQALHEALSGAFHGHPAGHADVMHHLLTRLESGASFESTAARSLVDEHLELLRQRAYLIADEAAVLLDSLDSAQRLVLEEHLRQAMAAHAG